MSTTGVIVISIASIAANLVVAQNESIGKTIDEYKILCPYNSLCNSPPSQFPPVNVDGFRNPGSCCSRCSCFEGCGAACCPDKPENYLSDQEIEEINEENTECLRGQFKTPDSDNFLKNGGFRMVVYCPADYKDDIIKAKCGREYKDFDHSEDLSYFGPVSNATTIYKNKHCALCNGVDEQDLDIWGVKIICQQPATYPDVKSFKEIIDAVNKEVKCDLFFNPADFMNFVSKRCSPRIERCNVTGLWKEFDPDIERACVSYTSFFKETYKNVHCYLCNTGSDVVVPNICELMPGGFIPNSFVALLDFRGLEETSNAVPSGSELCPHGYQYDPVRKECRLLSCPEYMVLKDGECQSIFQTLEGFNQMLYYITVSVEPLDNITNLSVDPLFMDKLYSALKTHVENVFYANNSDLTVCDVYGFMILRKNVSYILDDLLLEEDSNFTYRNIEYFAIKIEIGGIVSNTENEFNIIENIFENYRQDTALAQYIIRFRNIDFPLFERSMKAHSDYRAYGNPSLDFQLYRLVSSSQLRDSLGSTFVDKVTGLIIAPMHRATSDYCGAITHFQLQPYCPKVELNEEEFQVTENGIYVNLANSSLYHNEVIFTLNDTVLICFRSYFEFLNFSEQITTYTYMNDDGTLPITIVTVVVLALSIVSLVITLIVYTVFKQLRSLPGLIIIALAVCLLTSHLLTMLNGVVRISLGGICIAFGIALHFSLLISMFWMFVCTYHMAKVFIRLKTMYPDTTNKYHKMIRYTCFTTVTSALFVGTNIIVSIVRSKGKSIGYDDIKCYIDSTDMIVFTTAVPIGLVVVSNIVMFLCVMIKLSRVPSLNDCKNNERNNLKIFAKLSTLTGITYCFGFLYQFTTIEAFSYIFVICNASQGVFIMFAFVTNRRVAEMLKSFVKEKRNVSIKQTILQQSITSEQKSKKKTDQSEM